MAVYGRNLETWRDFRVKTVLSGRYPESGFLLPVPLPPTGLGISHALALQHHVTLP